MQVEQEDEGVTKEHEQLLVPLCEPFHQRMKIRRATMARTPTMVQMTQLPFAGIGISFLLRGGRGSGGQTVVTWVYLIWIVLGRVIEEISTLSFSSMSVITQPW